MSEDSTSSQLKCHYGLIASHLTSTTSSNPETKFFKCPKPKIYSYDYWKWKDEVFLDTPLTAIKELVVALDVVKVEMNKLREEVAKLEALNHSQVIKMSNLEEKPFSENERFVGLLASPTKSIHLVPVASPAFVFVFGI
ncbi:hypothetical protein RND71_035953 [Anisodus tanguticus]|uniref:Uncharacterized protein n=1 Tax=Anisodus tanguticus TaxID=243964 RepID=A0AAE1R7V2_9SOLA|nr:hypothetical protein RND71_035953 [Anisodus tanguticus]